MRLLIGLLLLMLTACATGTHAAREPEDVSSSTPHASASTTSHEGEAQEAAASSEAELTTDRAPFMTSREIWKVIEASPRTYHIIEGVPGTYTNQVWPVGEAPTGTFRVEVDASGARTVLPAESLPKASQQRFDVAEEAFKARRFKDAEAGYREVLARHPDNFMVQLVLGDALLFQGRSAEALAAYERAAELNPLSHAPWFFQASALLRLQRLEESADRYARALSLRPSWPSILQAVESNGKYVNRRVAPLLLKPRARAYFKDDAIIVEVDPERFAWMSHALCKAMWLGEPELREQRIGEASHAFTFLEEGECLSVLLAAHRSMREEQPDPALDRALQIAEDGFLAEMVAYEVLSRVVPMAIPTLSDEALERLHQYVTRYVLVPISEEAAAE